MSVSPITIAGFSSSSKVPGAVAEVVYGAGPINAASIPLVCLMVGLQLATGSALASSDVNTINNSESPAAYYGGRSELANMCYKALAIPGVVLKAAGVAEAAGSAAATLTVTFTLSSGANPVANGTCQYWIGGRYVSVSFSTTDTVTTIAAALVQAINANPYWPFTAASAAGVVTVTLATKGTRGNDYLGFQDVTKAAGTNVVSTVTGGAAVSGAGVKFTGGTGTESYTTLLSVLYPDTYDFVALAAYDAVSAAAWLASGTAKAGPLEMRPMRVVYGFTGSLVSATSLAQTTLNDQRSAVLWCLNGESAPSEIAAVGAALRCQLSQNDPDANFDGLVLPGIVPQRARADWAQRATQETALSAGVTPLMTVGNGVQIVRGIGTHSLYGATPDYRTLDWGDDYVPDFIRKDLVLFWGTEFLPSNPRVADDPAPEQRARPAGVATPANWNAAVQGRLQKYEKQGPVGPLPIVVNTQTHPPTSGYDSVAKRIMSLVPIEPYPNQHQIGLSIRQIVAA